MIRRELIETDPANPLILIRTRERVELHDMRGNIVEGRDATPAEAAETAAWEAAQVPGRRTPLVRTGAPDKAARAAARIPRTPPTKGTP